MGLNACKWAQFFCSFVVSYIPICISYKKLGSDWSTVRPCFLDIFHYIVLKNNFVGHTWYQKKETHFKGVVEFANQFIVTCLINQNLTSCKSASFFQLLLWICRLFKAVGYWDELAMVSVETALLGRGRDAGDEQHLQLARKVGDFLCCSGSALAAAWCKAEHRVCAWSFCLINRLG